jgi:DNA-binding LytR/AlgR family response regulator
MLGRIAAQKVKPMSSLPLQVRTSKVIPISGIHRLSVIKKPINTRGVDFHPNIDTIAIATKGKIEMIAFSEIEYVGADSNYIRFFLKNARTILTARTLKDVSSKLEKAGFIRVHKSFMLHPSSIRQFDIHEGYLVLRAGEKIPVSRSNRKSVAEKLLTWSL